VYPRGLARQLGAQNNKINNQG